MSQDALVASLKYYGVSPWELEVLYGLLNGMFKVEQNPDAEQDEDYSTMVEVSFPLEFSEEFFKWFGVVRWDKVKAILKEMKRRRGGGKTMKTYIRFAGNPNVKFIVDLDDHNWFNIAIEKIDFILELLQYHLDPQKTPQNVTDVVYEFDTATGRWHLHTAFSHNTKYVFSKNEWKIIT
ncbi:MAG: hypothetical protein ACREAG_01575 [Nitrosopumilaceae archaeon]